MVFCGWKLRHLINLRAFTVMALPLEHFVTIKIYSFITHCLLLFRMFIYVKGCLIRAKASLCLFAWLGCSIPHESYGFLILKLGFMCPHPMPLHKSCWLLFISDPYLHDFCSLGLQRLLFLQFRTTWQAHLVYFRLLRPNVSLFIGSFNCATLVRYEFCTPLSWSFEKVHL